MSDLVLPPIQQAAGCQRCAEALDIAREHLMEAARLADKVGASNVHRHVITAVASIDDGVTILSDGIAR